MGIRNGVHNGATTDASGFSMIGNIGNLPDPKYYHLYLTTNSATACNSGICYGQALSETSGWYSDFTGFVSATNLWMKRGGGYAYEASAGSFDVSGSIGGPGSYWSFRLVHK